MREIKFRGRRVDNGRWVYGWYLEGEGKPVIKKPECKGTGDISWSHYVIPETVGQLIGRKDKNGVEIWENDIARCDACHPETYQVVHEDGCWYFKNGEAYIEVSHLHDSFEVIGDMHTTPERFKEIEQDD